MPKSQSIHLEFLQNQLTSSQGIKKIIIISIDMFKKNGKFLHKFHLFGMPLI